MRLVALNEGHDIPVEKVITVVGRHPTCDTRLDSIRVSCRHCCMTPVSGELEVKDLGSTNGIQINGHRVESGRLRAGDILSIAHITYRLEVCPAHELTMNDAVGLQHGQVDVDHPPSGVLAARQKPAGGDPPLEQLNLEAKSARRSS